MIRLFLLLFSLPIIIIIIGRERRLGRSFPSSSSDSGLTLDVSRWRAGGLAAARNSEGDAYVNGWRADAGLVRVRTAIDILPRVPRPSSPMSHPKAHLP